MDAAIILFDSCLLGDAGEVALIVRGADAPGHAAVIGDGFVQPVAHHAVAAGVGGGGEEVENGLEGRLAVVVVGVDHGEGRIPHLLSGADHRVAGAEGLDSSLGDGVASGELVEFLIGIANLHGTLGQPYAYGGHEVLPDGLLDEDHRRAEAGLVGVINGIVQNGLPMGTNRVDLLEPTIPTAHSRSQNHKHGFV